MDKRLRLIAEFDKIRDFLLDFLQEDKAYRHPKMGMLGIIQQILMLTTFVLFQMVFCSALTMMTGKKFLF